MPLVDLTWNLVHHLSFKTQLQHCPVPSHGCWASAKVIIISARVPPSTEFPYLKRQIKGDYSHIMETSQKIRSSMYMVNTCIIQHVQSTLPKSEHRRSRRSFQVLFSLYSIVFNPSQVEFSLSRSYFFSPNRFDLGKVDCMCDLCVCVCV